MGWFALGLILGTFVGVFIMALTKSADDGED